MTLDQINYVLEIERTGSINKAATNLFISQSALSLAIQNLERELGQPIFVRSSRGVFPTPYGKSFIRYITPIWVQLHQVDALFFNGRQHDSLSFVLANDGFQVASEAFVELFQKYKSSSIYMKHLENYSNEAKSLVANGQADIGFVRVWTCYKRIEQQQFNALGLIYQQVGTVGLAIGVGPNHLLYHQDIEYVTANMLDGYPLIQHDYMDGGPYGDILDRLEISHPSSRVVTSSRAVVNEIVASTDAYYVTADMSPFYDTGSFFGRLIPLGGTDVQAELGWIAQRGVALNPIALEYTRLLEQRFI